MRNLITVFLALFIFTLSKAQSFENLSFEKMSKSIPGQPADWTAKENVAFSKVDFLAKEGNAAASVSGTFEQGEYGFVYQEQAIQISAMKKFKISAAIKAGEMQEGSVEVYAKVEKGEQYLNFKKSERIEEVSPDNWVTKSLTIWVDENATNLRIGVRFTGTATFFIDDFKVEEIEVAQKPLSATATAYIDEFLAVVSANSLYKESVDFVQLREVIEHVANGAQTIEEVHTALTIALKRVDKHSMFWPKKQRDAWLAPKEIQEGETFVPNMPVTTGRIIDGDVGYLNMPGVGSGNVEELIYFADSLQHLIQGLDRPGLKGWVLDLRQNTGGNCWPMLAGIGPILGEGECGYFALKEELTPWSYEGGASKMGGGDQIKVSGKPYELLQPNPKVAVLIGNNTASSGEVTAVAFTARPKTRSFGEASGGYTTTNSNFDMSDGSLLLLAVSVYADRTKRRYGLELEPDVLVEAKGDGDEPLEKAVEWLRKK